MMRKIAVALSVACGLWGAASGGAAAADPSPPDRAAIERIVRDYLRDHPEIVIEAIESYKKKQEDAELAEGARALEQRRAEIHNDPGAPVGGNEKGDVTLVEFFDYRCGVCKSVHPLVAELIRTDGKIRRIYKEWPILGPQSIFAARAALASRKQGKYLAFHEALMSARSELTEAQVFAIAAGIGIDAARLKRDMEDPEILATLQRNYALAEALRLNGTPSFVIGKTLLRGARDLDSMRALVAEARSRK